MQTLAAILLMVGGLVGLGVSVPYAAGVAHSRTRPSRRFKMSLLVAGACIAVALLIRQLT